MKPVVLIACEVCGRGCKEGESATYDHDGKECLIQSRSGGFICKECWVKFEKFVTSVTLCGSDEYKPPAEDPEKKMEYTYMGRVEERRWDIDDYYLIVTVQVDDGFNKGDEVEVTIRKVEPTKETEEVE